MADEKIVKTDNQPEEKVQKSAKDGKDAKPAKKKGRGLGRDQQRLRGGSS